MKYLIIVIVLTLYSMEYVLEKKYITITTQQRQQQRQQPQKRKPQQQHQQEQGQNYPLLEISEAGPRIVFRNEEQQQ